ncbi:DUF6160 family protein [Thalassolituus sp. C2-1]|uniref:DUF6160 family protein n=1 Tax=Venatorbacter sp. C2-1 TaxID=2597518 RepID=UPI001197D6A0|nr:DUF6160 family protein [Thalassolituus sp. C2-1]TVV43902.1 hypothetical protein FOT50_09655 [Thalassolituus sp. C2-1]
MKFLKKASLAAAIAAASISAQAEMVALDDATMSATTGQAGVTIEIDIDATGISIGEVEYKDEGSVLLQNITVKNVNNLTQEIDVDASGNLVIGMSGVTGMEVAIGDTAADATGSKSAVALRSTAGETTELVNNLDMTLNLGNSTTTIANLQAAGNAAALGITGDAATGSVAILANTSIEITDMNVGAFGYTAAQAATRAAAARANGDIADDDAVEAGYASQLANGSAVQVTGLKFYGTGGVGTAATIEQTIWAKGGSAAQGGGVYIQMGQIAGTLDIAGISMGGASIGSVKVSDINLNGMTQRIYGH